MTDIVERLRQYSQRNIYAEDLCIKAADEIEPLRAKLADPLVVAAPELLAACTALEQYGRLLLDEINDQDSGWYYQLQRACQDAASAIAKAVGGAA